MPSPFQLTTPLPPNELFFAAMRHSSGLSMLEEMQLDLLSEVPDLKAEDLLGQPVDLSVTLRDGEKRHFCGLVTRFGIGRHQGRYHGYQATVRPWLWFLTRTADCRIFQDKTVPEIVADVFADHGAIADHAFKLMRSYRKRVYCVQYRETDFNFVARLLEDEGIYWFFDHTAGHHRLVLVDDPNAHAPMPGNPGLPYHDNDGPAPTDTEWLSDWRFARGVKTGKTVLTSYDFERPSTLLMVKQALARSHPLDDLEVFDFQGDYTQRGDGQQLSDDRLDEQQCRFEEVGGRSNSHAMATGQCFSLLDHPREDQNGDYLCVQLDVSAHDQRGEAGGDAGDLQCSLSAIRADQVFRPPRRTPKPFVQGPQTAVVVGPSGEEIYTDKYGRVKVQFHWDRYGGKDEKSSCWVRVSSPWAGQSFGFMQVPRIGQEVVVDFLEGDPDQPIITGRVYNAEQMPPWELPANMTQSGVLTRSSKGGAYGNANALRFEDKMGEEQVWLHAEKNQDIEVENDETHWVGHDRTKTIDHDETVHVKHDRTEIVDNEESITIGVNRTEQVGNNESITIGSNRTKTVGASEYCTVGGSLTETVALNYAESVGAAMEITVGAAMAITVGAAMAETIGGIKSENVGVNKAETIGRNKSVTIGGDLNESVAKNTTIEVGKDLKLTVGGQQQVSVTKEHILTAKKIQLVGEDEVSIKCGSAEIIMKKNGDINIKGGKINVKGSGDVIIKGSKVQQN